LGQKSRSNAPPISSEIPLLKDKFRLQSNTAHREMCRDDTFRLLLKTFLKSYLLTKAKFYPSNLAKTEEDYARTRDKSGSNSPPLQGNVQIPPFPGKMHSQVPGLCPDGGCFSFNLTDTLGQRQHSFVYSLPRVPPVRQSKLFFHLSEIQRALLESLKEKLYVSLLRYLRYNRFIV